MILSFFFFFQIFLQTELNQILRKSMIFNEIKYHNTVTVQLNAKLKLLID